ncbi:MAG: translocation/assembly module TamB domain-containing protein [Muribaculaceae bacterium]|nr:translocation/assembly module TamB domain-containing protein [Muribaculaceae bacterium]
MIIRWIYKTFRSIIFTAALFVVAIYVFIYLFFSIPYFTNLIKDEISLQVSNLIGGKILIGDLEVFPFNEVKISNLEVYTPEGQKCLDVETIGAGINIWKLLREQKIELSFGEIIGLDAFIEQKEEKAPLNIDFIIKAFSNPDKTKEKKSFDLSLKNVVLRKSSILFTRDWLKDKKIGQLNLGYLQIKELAADISFPKISENEVMVDLRRLSMNIPDITRLQKIGLKGKFGSSGIQISNLILQLPSSIINIPSLDIDLKENENFLDYLQRNPQELKITQSFITPSDFASLFPQLSDLKEPLDLNISLKGNTEFIHIDNFSFGNPEYLFLSFIGQVEDFTKFSKLKGEVSDLDLSISPSYWKKLNSIPLNLPKEVDLIIKNIGQLKIKGNLITDLSLGNADGNLEINTGIGQIYFEGGIKGIRNKPMQGEGEVNISNFQLNKIVPQIPIDYVSSNIIAEGYWNEGLPDGMLSVVVEDLSFKGKKIEGFSFNLSKEKELIEGDFLADNIIGYIESNFNGTLTQDLKNVNLDLKIQNLNLSEIIDMKSYDNYLISGLVELKAEGNNLNDLEGELWLKDFLLLSPDNKKNLKLNKLNLNSAIIDNIHNIDLKSDWVDLRVEGNMIPKDLPGYLNNLIASILPAFVPTKEFVYSASTDSYIDFDILIKKNNTIPEFFNLPIRLLVPVNISGTLESENNSASLEIDVPYLQQGKDKLIYDTKITAMLDGKEGTLHSFIQTNLPVKVGDLSLNLDIFGQNNKISTDIRWINSENSDFKGHLTLQTLLSKNHFTSQPVIDLNFNPSTIQMGQNEWYIEPAHISYSDKYLSIDNLKIHHADQFIEINGKASPLYSDVLKVNLADIDVDYVFDLLQINYVTFGGTATGEISGHALLSGNPVAETDSFSIEDFSYNGSKIGKCLVSSKWNNEEKEIEISADISHNDIRRVFASGGVWLGRDSLCFDINADKVPVDFVQPFMAVFSSHVGGFASGEVKLFGNFHDIDMTGKIFADSVAVKLDYTNTIYHGSDSVFLNPGNIEIPNFRLYDKFGNTALFSGQLNHRFFHDPSFTFRLSDAENFLCYDTTSELNPDWYGILFGTGSALLQGIPGMVDISADMTVAGNSSFTFVLNETEYARDYEFLTFSDKRKEQLPKLSLSPNDFKELLKKRMVENENSLSKFAIDIRATVTPQVLFTLVMDPAAGDKITARGTGAMQVKYESDNDEMAMYGKYEIVEGNYNFSLQDIILRDFKIKEGSYISFNGNPLGADLDISATYRVNTNLSDLDKSFSTDKDLNRTNVPVDAVLSVTGNMQQPDITFDIELPTLTQDVERKVKSIISTDDMMNRQVIYLLALNRFYTPEYMGSTGNGGELAAVASSTISSQLSNMLGQLTDKFSVSPSFRSDKGDFSDIEVDVALSSRLLNNRLLINGNFGYRDRSNSSTTFVGDFDVEYLLSKNGNLRLKAYNHFNDQNYYLREALTTQGLGVVYRKDFDDWFTFLKKRKKIEKPEDKKSGDIRIKTEKKED